MFEQFAEVIFGFDDIWAILIEKGANVAAEVDGAGDIPVIIELKANSTAFNRGQRRRSSDQRWSCYGNQVLNHSRQGGSCSVS